MSSTKKFLEYQCDHHPKRAAAVVGLVLLVGLWEMVGLSVTGYWSPVKQLKYSPSREQYVSSKEAYKHVLDLYDKDGNNYLDSQEQTEALRQMYMDRRHKQPNDLWNQVSNGVEDSQNIKEK